MIKKKCLFLSPLHALLQVCTKTIQMKSCVDLEMQSLHSYNFQMRSFSVCQSKLTNNDYCTFCLTLPTLRFFLLLGKLLSL